MTLQNIMAAARVTSLVWPPRRLLESLMPPCQLAIFSSLTVKSLIISCREARLPRDPPEKRRHALSTIRRRKTVNAPLNTLSPLSTSSGPGPPPLPAQCRLTPTGTTAWIMFSAGPPSLSADRSCAQWAWSPLTVISSTSKLRR